MVFVERLGAAIARVPNDATAFGHRDAEYDLVIAAIWDDDSQEQAHVEWASSFWEATQPYSTDSVYVNYLSEEGEGRVRDVASHPSIEELCLAADVLVTDYSSVMFDYAVLDRPIVIHARLVP
jgi:hypothetical protein